MKPSVLECFPEQGVPLQCVMIGNKKLMKYAHLNTYLVDMNTDSEKVCSSVCSLYILTTKPETENLIHTIIKKKKTNFNEKERMNATCLCCLETLVLSSSHSLRSMDLEPRSRLYRLEDKCNSHIHLPVSTY